MRLRFLLPFYYSFCLIEVKALQADLLLPTVFLNATERRLRSSEFKGFPSFTISIIKVIISSNLSVYSASWAIKSNLLRSSLIIFKFIIKKSYQKINQSNKINFIKNYNNLI